MKPSLLDRIELLYDSAPTVVSNCVRGLLIAKPGHVFNAADFSNIEGRVDAWLGREDWKLDAFRANDAGTGPDLYLVAAAGIYGTTIEGAKPFRPVGKVSELALGFGGGIGALAKMAKGYRVDMAPALPRLIEAAGPERVEKAEEAYESYRKRVPNPCGHDFGVASDLTKQLWRDRHPGVVDSWGQYERAAIEAVENPGKITMAVGRVKFRKAGSFLFCQLPSGRCLSYAYPRIVKREVPWTEQVWIRGATEGEVFFLYGKIFETRQGANGPEYLVEKPVEKKSLGYKGITSLTNKWEDQTTYGGKLCENIVQATARDLLAAAMLRVEAANYPIVLHVHDELVSEIRMDFGSLEEYEALMSEIPDWAKGLPVAAKGWRGRRYRKG